MLNRIKLIYIISFSIISILCSCEKFEQDEGIQWHKPEKRIQQYSWSISKYIVDGLDSTDKKKEYLHNAIFRFYIDNEDSFILSYKTDKIEIPFAYWAISNKNENMKIVIWDNYILNEDSTFITNLKKLNGYFEVLKLSNKELKVFQNTNSNIDFVGN
ncbi:MAG TPA: hypothetical protein PL185_07185 [Flavobacteriales bacterium]|nr:hypothetical protein [Flavobacteriales bacterium]